LRAILAVLCFVTASSAAWAACPLGTYEWVDGFGNKICKNFGDGGTRSVQGSTRNCPAGTRLAVDDYGTKICKSFSDDQKFYDTSKGCPPGTHDWVDSFGNKTCKRF
jgi:hypothetical protein